MVSDPAPLLQIQRASVDLVSGSASTEPPFYRCTEYSVSDPGRRLQIPQALVEGWLGDGENYRLRNPICGFQKPRRPTTGTDQQPSPTRSCESASGELPGADPQMSLGVGYSWIRGLGIRSEGETGEIHTSAPEARSPGRFH